MQLLMQVILYALCALEDFYENVGGFAEKVIASGIFWAKGSSNANTHRTILI